MTLTPQAQEIFKSLPDPKDLNSPGSDRLFDAVFCLLVERGAELLADALQPGDVADRAGKARAGYYRTPGFPTDETVLGEVDRNAVLAVALDRLLNDIDLEDGEIVTGVHAYLNGESEAVTFREAADAILQMNFGVDDPWFIAYLFCAALSPSSAESRATLADFYENVSGTYSSVLNAMLEHFKMRPLPPFTAHDVSMLMTALHDGLAIRALVDERASRELYARAGLALLGALLGGEDDADRLGPIFDPAVPSPPRTSKSRHELISEITDYLSRSGPAIPDLDQLAKVVSCTPETLADLFGGLTGLLGEAWRDLLPPVYDAHQQDLQAAGLQAHALLRRHLVRVGRLMWDNMSLVAILLRARVARGFDATRSAMSSPTPMMGDVVVERLVARLGSESGLDIPRRMSCNDAEAATEFAELITCTLADTIMSRRAGETDADAHVEESVSYVWDLLIGR